MQTIYIHTLLNRLLCKMSFEVMQNVFRKLQGEMIKIYKITTEYSYYDSSFISLLKLKSDIINRSTNRRHKKTLYHQQFNENLRCKFFTVKGYRP